MKNLKKSYHHGNLKEDLIEKGIEIINEMGEEKLSLRYVAKMCGVSNAAPYTYFKKKEDLLEAISNYIWKMLAKKLNETREKYKNKEEAFAEIECYLRQDKVFNRPLDMENFDENTSAKRFIQAIIDHQVPLPKGYHYEGDIDYLKEILEKI